MHSDQQARLLVRRRQLPALRYNDRELMLATGGSVWKIPLVDVATHI